ncbi:MAG TPA: DnaJ domain-containing protein [Sphingomicrobium sp.]|nr:DnaJ domain-containing protein [Sphingomicrobium sp.]
MPDHYQTLGIGRGASGKEVEEAFKARVREHMQHPDVAEPALREQARAVNLAYESLRDPEQRRAYDASLGLSDRPRADAMAGEPPRSMMFASSRQQEFEDRHGDADDWSMDHRSDDNDERAGRGGMVAAAPLIGRPGERALHGPVPDRVGNGPRHGSIAEFEADEDDGTLDARRYADPPRNRRDRKRLAAIGAGALLVGLGALAWVATQDDDNAGRVAGTASSSGPATAVRDQFPSGSGELTEGQVPGATDELAAVGESALPPGFAPLPPELPVPADYRAGVPEVSAPSANTQTPAPAEKATGQAAPLAGSGGNAVPATAAPTAQILPTSSAPQSAQPAPTSSSSPPTAVAQAAPPPAATPAPVPAPPPVNRTAAARWISGGLMDSDNPGGRFQGSVSVRFIVRPNGTVADCRPIASSGNPALDSMTCALTEQRLRFIPALDRQGRPVASEIRTSYTWGRRQRR